MVTVDWVSKRYGMLPSEFIARGNSLDIMIADLGVSYENHINKKAEAKSKGKVGPAPDLSQDEMQKMLSRVRNKNK